MANGQPTAGTGGEETSESGDGRVYRTVFTVEVFSEGPFAAQGADHDPFSLAEINYAIVEGDCIGMVSETSSAPVPDAELEAHLLRIGNDGSFFDREG